MQRLLSILVSNKINWVLVPLGVMTALLLAAPQLVVVGLFFLIVPGLILALIPTVFVYLLGTSLIRCILPIRSEIVANLIAFMLTLGVSAAAMAPWRNMEMKRFSQATQPDITPDAKVMIAGNVLLDWEVSKYPPSDEVDCDYLCAALLDTPGVTSVTRACEQGSATFRCGANQPGQVVTPVNPHEILDKFAKLNEDRRFRSFDATQQAERAVQADWAMRIAQGNELRRDQPIALQHIEWTIQFESSRNKQPKVKRLEIRDRGGNVIARKSLVQHFIPSRLFYFGFQGGSSADGFSGAKFTLGGSNISNQQRYYDLDGAVELLRLVDIPQPTPQPNIIAETERLLVAALENPAASHTELLMAPMWMEQFRYMAGPDQMKTIEMILLDDRIPDPAEHLRTALSGKTDLTPLRAGLTKRYLSAVEPKSKSWYITALVGLADETFASPTEDEQAIWRLAFNEHEAAPFVERLADQGEDAVPKLLELLDESLTKPWHARWRVLKGIREAFKRLGPEAEAAAPRIQALITESPQTLLNSAGDRTEWLITLNLMGVQLQDLPYGIRQLDAAQLASESVRIQKQVERYKKNRHSQNH